MLPWIRLKAADGATGAALSFGLTYVGRQFERVDPVKNHAL
jgi:hypothetical protein